jgi:hypothetical protein
MNANARRHSYLLRLWAEPGVTESGVVEARWRLSLQDVHSGEQYGFRDLDELCAYLRYRITNDEPCDRLTISESE